MKEILEVLLQTAQGTILLFTIVAALIMLIVWLCIKVLPNIRKVGWKEGITFDDNKLVLKPGYYQQNVSVIKSIIGDEYEKYIVSKEELNSHMNREIKDVQTLALNRAIQHLCLEFGNLYENNINDTLSRNGLILELYLNKDFSEILINRLDMLRKSSLLLDKSDIEINNEIQSITEDCVLSMKHKIKNYILIPEHKMLIKLFDTSTIKIKDTIDEAIKSFIRLTKDQQEKLIKLTKKRNDAIAEKIANILNEEEVNDK